MRNLLLPLLLIVSIAACAPAADGMPAPTAALIPPTAPLTPSIVPPTLTPIPGTLTAPDEVVQPTPSAGTSAPETPRQILIGDTLLAQDAIAAELVGMAQRDVAEALDLPTRRVRVVDVRPVVWTDTSLNCPLPDQVVTASEIDGYRIVLEAADQEYLFHTDVDRVVPCNPVNEQLPPDVFPTEEATEEAG